MKKILLSLLLVAGVLTSCDMDKNPYGTLNGEDPFAGMNDASRYRNGIYSGIRAVATSAYFTNPEIQMDMFQATNQVGNRGIVFASGDILASTGETGTYYGSLLMQVASVNYYLEKMSELMAIDTDEANMVAYNRFVGEAKFARSEAFLHTALMFRPNQKLQLSKLYRTSHFQISFGKFIPHSFMLYQSMFHAAHMFSC